ncbi:MAG TPA: DUF5681 domain-containing protein [Verrucomicrobiae bacterium]|nr:DUF5681 domain-containing protein [Verrucomicrobiae bacterium]
MAFKKGTSGNPSGRPRGTTDRRSELREQLAAEGPKLLRKLVALAKGGDVDALKFLVSRLVPPVKELPVSVQGDGTLAARGDRVLQECLEGRIAPDQAANLLAALTAQSRLAEHTELEKRMAALEKKLDETYGPTPQPR